jgi:Spy/CpxP family protein refolding chaperone
MRGISKKSIVLAALLVMAGAAIVFAYGGGMGLGLGQGRGPGMMGCGTGPNMMGQDGYGPGMRGWGMGGPQLSKEEVQKLEAARNQFLTETRTLREQIAERSLNMRAELFKQNPDSAKLTNLQQELSQLEAQFDQKALQHRLEVRKIVPDAGMGMGKGKGQGCC